MNAVIGALRVNLNLYLDVDSATFTSDLAAAQNELEAASAELASAAAAIAAMREASHA